MRGLGMRNLLQSIKGIAESLSLGIWDCPRVDPRDGDQMSLLFYASFNTRQRFLIHRAGVPQFCLPVMHALTPHYPVKIT